MSIRTSILAAGAILATSTSALAADDWRITTAGYGPAKIGMSVDEAAKALGVTLVAEGPVDNPECHYMRPEPAVEGLWFMISKDRVARIEVNAPGVKTRSGLGVGDSEAHVKETLGKSVEATPQKSGGWQLSHRLRGWPQGGGAPRDPARQGHFFYAGRAPEVEYVEGCS